MNTQAIIAPGRALSALVLGLGLSASACHFDASFDGTEYLCDGNGACPEGQRCVAGVCRSGLVEPPPTEACGTMAAGIQDFENLDLTNLDWRRWSYWADLPEFMSVVGGQLRFDFPIDAMGAGAGFRTKGIFPLSDAVATIQVVEDRMVPESAFELELFSRVNNSHAGIYAEAGTIYMHYHPEAGSMDLATFAYDAAVHRVWRLRESEDTLYWETSVDGVDFVTHATRSGVAADFGVWVGSGVEAWKDSVSVEPASLVLDNLNGGQEPVPFCPSAILVDDFEAPTMGPAWDLSDSGVCTIHQENGRLGFDFPEAGAAECIQYGATLFDLSNSMVSVEAPLADAPGIEQCLKIILENGQDVEFELLDGELRGEKSLNDGSGTVFSVQFDAALHRFLRFRGAGDTLYWELSSDGVEWQTMGSHQSPNLGLERARITLVGDSNLGLANNVGQGMDNLNIIP